MNNTKKEKINYQRIAPIIALTFAVGFGVATGSFFLVHCETLNCFPSPPTPVECDERCLGEGPPPPPLIFTKKGICFLWLS